MALRESAARTRLEVALEADCRGLVPELDDDVEFPRTAPRRVWTASRVVVDQSRGDVGREADHRTWGSDLSSSEMYTKRLPSAMIRLWQASCLMRVIQRRSTVRRTERRAVVSGSGRSRCVGCFCNLRAFVAGTLRVQERLPRASSQLALVYRAEARRRMDGCRAELVQAQNRPASASLCYALARHPSPAFMSEGWWPRFVPDGTH